MIGALLRLYPREWRERYGEELRDFIGVEGLTLDSAFDIVLQAVRVRSEARRRRLVARPGGVTTDGSGGTSWLVVLGALALVPAAVLGLFGLAFTVVGIPVDPFVPIVGATFDVLPMTYATSLLALASALAALVSLVLRSPRRRPGAILTSAWSTSRAASLLLGASLFPLGVWICGEVSWILFNPH